ncbi:MAG: methyltransferase domain-containing protein [Hyphomonadaceae bacterium]
MSLTGKRAMELGPGINLVGCIGLRALGAAKVYVADRWIAPWQEDYNPIFCRMMAERIRAEGHSWDASIFEHVAANGYDGTLELVSSAAEDLAQTMPEQVDAIYSNAVLEHMVDHLATVRALARITAPGGINFHQVDFRYHENFDRPLDYLLMMPDEFLRESIAKHYELGCQLRPYELKAMFEEAGFSLSWHPNAFADDAYLAEFLPRLRASQSAYRDVADELLREVGGLFVLRR